MAGGFSFDQKALDSVVNHALKDVAKDAQRRLDRVHRQYAGAPVGDVEQALLRALSGTAVDPDRAPLNDWSTLSTPSEN